jgi:hypothetical protein
MPALSSRLTAATFSSSASPVVGRVTQQAVDGLECVLEITLALVDEVEGSVHVTVPLDDLGDLVLILRLSQ